jgi:hypothetical protein
VADTKAPFDWGVVFRALLCLFLGGSLFLFIRNNYLAYGSHIFYTPEALVMLGVLGIPFLLSLLHFMRSFRPPSQPS